MTLLPQRETEEGGRWRETRRERDRDREGEKYARMKEFIPNSYRKGESERGKTSERERERVIGRETGGKGGREQEVEKEIEQGLVQSLETAQIRS